MISSSRLRTCRLPGIYALTDLDGSVGRPLRRVDSPVLKQPRRLRHWPQPRSPSLAMHREDANGVDKTSSERAFDPRSRLRRERSCIPTSSFSSSECSSGSSCTRRGIGSPAQCWESRSTPCRSAWDRWSLCPSRRASSNPSSTEIAALPAAQHVAKLLHPSVLQPRRPPHRPRSSEDDKTGQLPCLPNPANSCASERTDRAMLCHFLRPDPLRWQRCKSSQTSQARARAFSS